MNSIYSSGRSPRPRAFRHFRQISANSLIKRVDTFNSQSPLLFETRRDRAARSQIRDEFEYSATRAVLSLKSCVKSMITVRNLPNSRDSHPVTYTPKRSEAGNISSAQALTPFRTRKDSTLSSTSIACLKRLLHLRIADTICGQTASDPSSLLPVNMRRISPRSTSEITFARHSH